MLVILTYDVNMTSDSGAKRLRKVAKLCEKYGLRVQNSVFEVLVDNAQLIELKSKLEKTINHEQDSIRFYRIGNTYENRIEAMGKAKIIETGGSLIL